MKRKIELIVFAGALLLCCAGDAVAQRRKRMETISVDTQPRLTRVYFNLYTDSIKAVLNYYVNVEGAYSNGRILPMDTGTVKVTADVGIMQGMEWLVKTGMPRYEKVTFTVEARSNPAVRDEITVWLKKSPDPEDERILNQPTGHGR